MFVPGVEEGGDIVARGESAVAYQREHFSAMPGCLGESVCLAEAQEGSRPRFGVNDYGPGSWLVMLGDRADSFRRRLLGVDLGAVQLGRRVEQLAAQLGEQAGAGGGHVHAAPAA